LFTQEVLQGIFAQKYLLKFPNDGGKKLGKRENPLPLFSGWKKGKFSNTNRIKVLWISKILA
jgi:hypothetical protein